jgi:hypothetical protein
MDLVSLRLELDKALIHAQTSSKFSLKPDCCGGSFSLSAAYKAGSLGKCIPTSSRDGGSADKSIIDGLEAMSRLLDGGTNKISLSSSMLSAADGSGISDGRTTGYSFQPIPHDIQASAYSDSRACMFQGYFAGKLTIEDSGTRRLTLRVANDLVTSLSAVAAVQDMLLDAIMAVTGDLLTSSSLPNVTHNDKIRAINEDCVKFVRMEIDIDVPSELLYTPEVVLLQLIAKMCNLSLFHGSNLLQRILSIGSLERASDPDQLFRYFGQSPLFSAIKSDKTILEFILDLQEEVKEAAEMWSFAAPVQLEDLDVVIKDGQQHPFLTIKMIVYLAAVNCYYVLPMVYNQFQVRSYVTQDIMQRAAKGLLDLSELIVIVTRMQDEHVGLPKDRRRVHTPAYNGITLKEKMSCLKIKHLSLLPNKTLQLRLTSAVSLNYAGRPIRWYHSFAV